MQLMLATTTKVDFRDGFIVKRGMEMRLDSFSSYLDPKLLVVIKRLALEESVTRNNRVPITLLLNEAFWDLAEKYGKVEPGERPHTEGEMKPDRSGRRGKKEQD